MIEQQHHEIEVHCLPTNLPETLSADISGLELNDTLQIGDIHYPDGVTPTLEGDVIVVLVSEPRVSAGRCGRRRGIGCRSADEAEKYPTTAEEETK